MPASQTNPQGGSASSSSSGGVKKHNMHRALPPLFLYMEVGDWKKATERATRHPGEVKSWATLRTKAMAEAGTQKVSATKRLALHHACFKLRSVLASTGSTGEADPFMDVCRFILLLIQLYPEAAGMRESRHGCLPLHLVAFASCSPRPPDEPPAMLLTHAPSLAHALPHPSSTSPSSSSVLPRPSSISRRCTSESTAETNMSAVLAEERYSGTQTMQVMPGKTFRRQSSPPQASAHASGYGYSSVSVAPRNGLISARREDMAVQVLNALLDAYPKGIKVDSEGGRLPLHTACAGRATPRIISTLLTVYPAAARHRNKDGFLPLHLAAHWGVSHPNVAVALLKTYPDATLGRNRWERTPLEEALCMAGENGRPHQAALVRALRKHPSYWTRPPSELFRTIPRGRTEGTNVVDIDETLPDDDTSSQEEEQRYSGHAPLVDEDENCVDNARSKSRMTPRSLMRKGVKKSADPNEPSHATPQNLITLIKNQAWEGVLARLEFNPHEASRHFKLTTRGGFVATGGFTPLAYACERRPPKEVVAALLNASPEAAVTKVQPGGALPLHIACTWHAPESVVSVLLSAEPAACRVPDEMGNIPLHAACFAGAMASVIDAVIRTYPKGVVARNNQGSLPGDICKRLRHENRKSVLALLEGRKDEFLVTHHRRSRSSGSFSMIAKRAAELNAREGPPIHQFHALDLGADELDMNAGVEVSYDDDGDGEMVWI